MEKERSKRVEETNKESRKKIETNSSRLTTREIIAKRIKRNLSQDAAVPQTITGKSSRFLGAVSRRYPGRKQSLLKRLSECSLSPCSEEYACVMQGFKETEVEPESIFVAPSRQTRNRKISFNGFGQGSKYSSAKLSSEFESALSFRPRPRGNTLPARVNDVRVIPAAGTQPGGKTKPVADRHVFDVKLAWQGTNDDLNLPTKKVEKKRHVSLSDLPQRRQLSGGTAREEKNNRKLSATFQIELLPGKSDKSGRKISQRKKPDIDLPKIEEIILTDHLQIKPSEAEICQHENRGNVITAEQTDDESPALQRLASLPQRERSYSSEYFTESKGTTSRVKAKLSYSISSGPVLCNGFTTEASWNRRDIDAESPKNYFETQLGQPSSLGRRTSQFAITRANISRVGKAALVASRLLKIHYRENGAKKVSITEEEKELEKLFEEMKDCRYLRKGTSEMKI